ncbi:MAG: GDSL-type esterase/lipase family protein [Clostridium sp.]|jgi:lysophospholipase L1-like esterase|nr:GDSL-type esterase/lipase family protein [Clostridium sp.]
MPHSILPILLTALACVVAAAAGIGLFAASVMYPAVPRPRGGAPVIACVGDSITYGWGIKKRRKNSYPAQLQRLLGNTFQLLNYGLSNRTLQDEGDMPYRRNKLYSASLTASPAVVLIMLGTNDLKRRNWDAERFEKALSELVRIYKELPCAPKVFLLNPPPIYQKKNTEKTYRGVLTEVLLPIFERVAEKEQIGIIDTYSPMQKPELYWDGLHPTAEGARVMAEVIAPYIQP